MTYKKIEEIVKKRNIRQDVVLMSDSGWEERLPGEPRMLLITLARFLKIYVVGKISSEIYGYVVY
jgi:hypothetical protein